MIALEHAPWAAAGLFAMLAVCSVVIVWAWSVIAQEWEMANEELRCALEVATENRRILAQAVLDENEAFHNERASDQERQDKYDRMLSLAEEMVK